MDTFYTCERNVQMVIFLMKAHGVRLVVASPGTTNLTFVASIQQDEFFEIYSCVDERSAAYMACGLAEETGEPVALTCTGATASRNYLSGMTEAYYRNLPVLAITAAQGADCIQQNSPQSLDRSQQLADVCKISVQVPIVHDAQDERAAALAINRAMLELSRRGGGPAHIDMVTHYSSDFTVRKLPPAQVIRRICYGDELPPTPVGPIGVFVGSHARWSKSLTERVERFCATYDAVVLCDHTSNYFGTHGVDMSLVCHQESRHYPFTSFELIIDLGSVSGSYSPVSAKDVWRVSPDGEIRQRPGFLVSTVFEMREDDFFACYNETDKKVDDVSLEGKDSRDGLPVSSLAAKWQNANARLLNKVPELPFSNMWIAQRTAPRIPPTSEVHLGILNSLRSWNSFPLPKGVLAFANTGGFGIDGYISACIGASLIHPSRPYFLICGDLAFFYDMNSLGNRHVGKNLRILLVNNGRGTEFRNYNHPAASFGTDADTYIAAAGHFGMQSKDLVRHYAQDLGFEYLAARSKEEYLSRLDAFTSPAVGERSIVLEVFTNPTDESEALRMMNNLEVDDGYVAKSKAKRAIRSFIGERGVRVVRGIVN